MRLKNQLKKKEIFLSNSLIGIYKITSPTGKIYIGQSSNIESRRGDYRRGWCHKGKLKSSIKKYGFENHIFEVLEECEIENLNERERFYQEQFEVLGPNGLNLILQQTNTKRLVRSKETCEKLSKVHLGKEKSELHKKNLVIAQKNFHLSLTEEQKLIRNEKNSKSNTGKPATKGNSKKVINTETGEIFDSITLAAKSISKSREYIGDRLLNITKNNTNFKYYKNE